MSEWNFYEVEPQGEKADESAKHTADEEKKEEN